MIFGELMQFNNTNISKNAKFYIDKVLDSGRVSAGEMAREFEEQLMRELKLSRRPVSVNSGTSALHLSLAVAGIRPGEEVILSPQTFIATGLSVLMQNLKIVFADIQPNTGNISPQSIRDKITPKTKAIMAVHWAGYPCDMDEIHQIAKEHGLTVIEDAAHALGATYKGKPIGSISDFTIFSFQAIKHLTTGDGGAVCCLTDENERKLSRRRWFNIDRDHAKPSILGEREYNSDSIGYKYHMNDLAAALGLGNLTELHNTLSRHRTIGAYYRKNLANVPGITLLDYSQDRESSFWMCTLLVDRREEFIRALKDRGVASSVVHRRIDKNQVFGGITPNLSGQEFFDLHQVALPVHTGLTDEDLDSIVASVKKGW